MDDILLCKAMIPENHKKVHDTLYIQFSQKKTRANEHKKNMEQSMDNHNINTAVALGSRKDSAKKARLGEVVEVDNRVLVQTVIHNGPNPSAESGLTIAISNVIHSLGLPLHLASEPKFHWLLKLAKVVPATYKPLTRRSVSTNLQKLNYNQYQKAHRAQLVVDANIFGLCLFGDGATVKRMPALLNILAPGVHEPAAVLEVVDCSGHVLTGGKKDACYIAELFLPHLQQLDPGKNCFDLVYFDGASNVQKAGNILTARYPRATCLHGSKHVVALSFQDIPAIPQVKGLISFYREIYMWFESGAHHTQFFRNTVSFTTTGGMLA